MTFDLARARAETPGCQETLHLDAAGAALMPQAVIDAQIAQIQLEARVGGYRAAELAGAAVARTYDAVAELLNCGSDEVALVENATVGWNLAFHGLKLEAGDRVITAEAEYASNYLAFLKAARERGIEIVVVPSDNTGQLDAARLAELIDQRVKLIAITHVPTNCGLVNPAAEVGRLAKAAGVPFLLDACQSAGQMVLDVERIGCDLLSASGRKFLRGPRGSGFLYVRRGLLDRLEPPWPDLRSAHWTAADAYELRPGARRFENWEFNYAAVIGLGVAIDHALGWGLPAVEARLKALAEALRARLAGLPGARLRDIGKERAAIVAFELDGHAPSAAKAKLAEQGIIVSNSTLNSTRLDMERRGLTETLRASPHIYNSEAELDRFVEALAAL
ncbi:MAG: aminotransferase class V-fold PLP-dependent enzyme [Pseudomonadota bacterium]